MHTISLFLDDEDESSTEEDESNVEDGKVRSNDKEVIPGKVADAKETEAGAEISALVNYVQPVHFSTFEHAESKFYLYFCTAIFIEIVTQIIFRI